MSVKDRPDAGTSLPLQRLREAGYRITQQRAQLLSLLAEKSAQGEHLDAEGLHACAVKAGMDVSLATVYRTLAVFKKLGLVAPHHFAHKETREFYETVSNGGHHHFTCLGCGVVLEFNAPAVEAISKEVAEQLDVQVNQASLYLQGYCATCQASGRPGPAPRGSVE